MYIYMYVYLKKKKQHKPTTLFSRGMARLNSPELLKMKYHASPISLFEDTKAKSCLFIFFHSIRYNQRVLIVFQVNLPPASKALEAWR